MDECLPKLMGPSTIKMWVLYRYVRGRTFNAQPISKDRRTNECTHYRGIHPSLQTWGENGDFDLMSLELTHGVTDSYGLWNYFTKI